MEYWIGRVVFAQVGALFCALVVALVEARSALVATGSHAPSFSALLAAEIGVLAPLALVLGAAVAAASLLLEPGPQRAPSERLAALRAQPILTRSRTAAAAPIGSAVAAAWLVLTGQMARGELARGAPATAGGVLAVGSIAWLLGLCACGLALVPALRRALASAAVRWPRAIDPVATGAAGLAGAILVVAAGVAIGDTGGQGPGPLAIFGVLKRSELDLRPLFDAVAIAACAWLAPLALGGAPPRVVPLLLALVALGGATCVTGYEAVALEADPAPALAVESHAALGRIALALLRRVTDRDHDGASPYFGGGDCDDHDPSISPFAVDIPGNGIDEDCSGADLPLPSAAPTAMKAPAVSPRSIDRDYNLLLVTIDTLRAGELGCMGYEKPTSAHLDALAQRSVVFDQAYSMASYTGKALAPMLIGKYPSETSRDGGHFNKYFASNTFVAERLRRAGMFTMAAAPHWYFKEPYGLTRGFDRVDLSAMPAQGQTDTDTTVTGDRLTDAAIKLLSELAAQRRFFLWVHYFDPHLQYVPHPGAPDFSDPSRRSGWKMHAAYDGEVWFTDQMVGRLLDYVDGQSWGKDTIVVVTSDHGEAMNEHAMGFQHGFELWEPLVRIPLIVRVPGTPPHHVPVKRSAIDLAPTLLELMRVPLPGRGELSGQSLLPDLLSKPGETYEERDVYIDMPDGPFTHMRRALVHGATPGMKLVHLGGRQYQLYDLARDPEEMEDLSGDPNQLTPMLEALQAKRAALREIYVKPDAPPAP